MHKTRIRLAALFTSAVIVLLATRSSSQDLSVPLAAFDDLRSLAAAMPALAEQVLLRSQNPAPTIRFRLEMAAGRYPAAAETFRRYKAASSTALPVVNVPDEILVTARLRQAQDNVSFEEAFSRAFRDVFGALDDRTAVRAAPWLDPAPGMRNDLAALATTHRGKNTISPTDAIALIRLYQLVDMYEVFAPLTARLRAEDDGRRFIIDRDVLIKTPDGATIAGVVVRPRQAAARGPALLQFSIYAYEDRALSSAKETAAHGYAGVEAFTRGKARSPDPVVPFERDGDDARAVIEWIAGQPWSDGRVGMFGGSYSGFTPWAAAKRRPSALKAIMTSATAAPGIDVPMEGNVFQTFFYKWPLYAASGPAMDDRTNDDRARWQRLESRWFESGRPYRELPSIDGTPNPFWGRWLDHPGYDSYWQSMIPYGREFADIDIPVLQTTGYFDGGQVGVLHYFDEHVKHRREADHTILVGPFGHLGAQHQADAIVRGYAIDPVARIDIHQLRYEWFDHVLKGTPRPALLRGRINYEVMGANVWKHASSLETMSAGRQRFYVTSSGDIGQLAIGKPSPARFTIQEIRFSERSVEASQSVVSKTIATGGGLVFRSEPFPEAVEVSGLFSGELHLVADKRDLDVRVQLYEQTSQGDYFRLSGYVFRASYARDRSRRQLLTPGRLTVLPVRSQRFTSRQLQPGSRLVFVVGANKEPGAQVNYGSGTDVSGESLARDGAPLHLQWSSDSFIDIPVTRPSDR